MTYIAVVWHRWNKNRAGYPGEILYAACLTPVTEARATEHPCYNMSMSNSFSPDGGTQLRNFVLNNQSPWEGRLYQNTNQPWRSSGSNKWPDRTCNDRLETGDYFQVIFDPTDVADPG